MVDFFDEVTEDLRAEQTRQWLRRYGWLAAAAVLLLVVGIGCWQGWRAWQARQDAGAANAYLAAMIQADALPADAGPAARAPVITAFQNVVATAPDGYRALARLRLAALQAAAGKPEDAAATWNALAGDSAADPLLRDLANLLWAQQGIDHGDPALVEARLKPLTAADNPWHPLARMYTALLDVRTGRIEAARAILLALESDPAAPEGLRGRAGGLHDQLGG